MDTYLQEVKNFRQNWPEIKYVDVIFTDLNATPRGKRIPVDALEKLAKGVALPLSTITLDTKGAVVESAGLGEDLGEPDNLCFPVSGTLLPTAKEGTGQVLLSMMEDDAKRHIVYLSAISLNVWWIPYTLEISSLSLRSSLNSILSTKSAVRMVNCKPPLTQLRIKENVTPRFMTSMASMTMPTSYQN
ncbi:gamma-glutamyl-putrescine synthetase [Vibrio variabilis]|uniref:Gamma-glutamyl-putrescine synthetase n=1 Tax=Vibrio variabilis TaxID=990271 RepID=A0ABQ0JQH8_9VIBR|nr:gamma-glutamyl-putrescine synthetase [Vibrio variabilis]